jgi:hypothetical protein
MHPISHITYLVHHTAIFAGLPVCSVQCFVFWESVGVGAAGAVCLLTLTRLLLFVGWLP